MTIRLQILENGHSPIQKLIMSAFRLTSAGKTPGPVLVMSYRRELFGKHLARCYQEALRESTEWTAGEAELFAAFVSRLNECKY